MSATLALLPHVDDRVRERLALKYETDGDGCWTWTGTKSNGYGIFGLKVGDRWRTVKAHRLSYEVNVGPIPDGLQLDHLCRNRACVNPNHLEPVDNRTNTLRGQGPCAFNARVTHCPKGHEYTPENTITKTTRCGGEGRECRECNRQRIARGYQVEGGLPCPECGQTYGTKKGLNAHLGKRHGMGTRHRIAAAIAEGLSVEATAERVGCSVTHVKVELKNLEVS